MKQSIHEKECFLNSSEKIRLAAVGDLHCNKSSKGTLRAFFSQADQSADILLLCGDLTDYGLSEEAYILSEELSAARIPVIAVLGNHDFETDNENEVKRILGEAGVRILDGDACEVNGVGFAGVKGFCGGYGQRSLGHWGEPAIKHFVDEAIRETLKLEAALAKLRTDHRIALLHYSPIEATVRGEPLEIYPFLGTSRLEEPLMRYPVDAVFHGHAHRGSLEGRTVNNIPVYNVAKPLLQRTFPDQPPFKIIDIPLSVSSDNVTPLR
ncbi:MAG: metallophosphoesterase [Paucimonas sp.]|jgi:Icc-related predicted phosphoesterase|nr:metallophosphoesterase [Paucimonas sp.]